MKKLLFTLVLLFSLHSFGQISVTNPVSDTFVLMSEFYQGPENAAIVPEGKFWTFGGYTSSDSNAGRWVWSTAEYYDSYGTFIDDFNTYILAPGCMVWWINLSGGNNYVDRFLQVKEHNFITDTSLSSTNVELPNQIRLFPNPTTSEVVLNSDKQYDIEVYDILGNKVMELTGNTIDMEHLSSATYIVDALDTETNERLSYKVIKH